MPNKLLLAALLTFAITGVALFATAQQTTPTKRTTLAGAPIPIIFDTDMGPDYDDVGAITILHAFADSGKCNILATMASNRYEGVAAVLNTFNTYFHRPGIPIGVPGRPSSELRSSPQLAPIHRVRSDAPDIRDTQHWTDSILAVYPHAIRRNADAEDAVTLYRKILARQPDHSVVVVTVGFQSNLAGLLASKPDKNSPLDGPALIAQKVQRLVCMAGAFPHGNEFNVNRDIPAAQAVAKDWPTIVIYSGFEIGKRIKTGLPLINNEAIRHSPVKDVFRIGIAQSAEDTAGRMSWDETAVLVALAGHAPWYTLQHGQMRIEGDGSNTWVNSTGEQGRRAYLIEAVPPATVQNLIDRLIMHQPK